MTTDRPTPEEAAAALREANDQHRAARRNAQPAWTIAAVGVLVIALGVASDLNSAWQPAVNLLLMVVALGALLASRSKRFGALLGYRRSPSANPVLAPKGARAKHAAAMVAAMVVTLVLASGLRMAQVPFPSTIGSVLIVGLMLVWVRVESRGRERRHG